MTSSNRIVIAVTTLALYLKNLLNLLQQYYAKIEVNAQQYLNFDPIGKKTLFHRNVYAFSRRKQKPMRNANL